MLKSAPMPADNKPETGSTLYDSQSVYGWISILLHWITAIAIVALWFLGKAILAGTAEDVSARRSLHISWAASAWLLFLARVVWRAWSGHPHVRGQTDRIHIVAKSVHYASLVTLLIMMVSGPLTVWARGFPVNVFGWFSVPAPIAASERLADTAYFVHSNAAALLLVLVLVHIGGALKHLMFHTDDTIVRMLWPGRPMEKNE